MKIPQQDHKIEKELSTRERREINCILYRGVLETGSWEGIKMLNVIFIPYIHIKCCVWAWTHKNHYYETRTLCITIHNTNIIYYVGILSTNLETINWLVFAWFFFYEMKHSSKPKWFTQLKVKPQTLHMLLNKTLQITLQTWSARPQILVSHYYWTNKNK